MELIASINSAINGFVWGVPMLVLLVGGGILLTIRNRGVQFRKFGYAMKNTIGKIFKKGEAKEGEITPFQAMSTQTRDPQLGRLMLYRLSYFRKVSGQGWIRTTEGISQQIYSLPHLATLVLARCIAAMFVSKKRAEDGTQTRDPQLGRLMLYRLSYFRKVVGKDGFEPPKA